jgi:hypothetical protein
MKKPICTATRLKIISDYKEGLAKSTIASKYSVSRQSVHTLIKRYEESGENGLKPHYDSCGKSPNLEQNLIFRAVRYFRYWHPTWGSEKIRAQLLFLRPSLDVPSSRTIHRWLSTNEQIPKGSKLPRNKAKWVQKLHECWQIDAKESMYLSDGSYACWLNIVDEYSGTVISPPVFPLCQN